MSLITDQFANFAVTTLAGGAGGVGTTLATGDLTLFLTGGVFPGTTNGTFPILLGTSTPGAGEIVLCTVRSGLQCTILRHQEGTTAQTWPVGTPVTAVASAQSWINVWNRIQGRRQYVVDYGAKGDATTDDSTAINACISAAGQGGIIILEDAFYLVNFPLALIYPGLQIYGAGRGCTYIRPGTAFSGAAVFSVTMDYATLRGFTLAFLNQTIATNPAANGIEVSGARYCTLYDLEIMYLNGWAIEIKDSGTVAPLGSHLDAIHVIHCANGIHTLGATARTYGIQTWMSNLNLEIVDTGDNLLIEDSSDVLVVNLNGAAGQNAATNSTIHIKGACSSVMFSNVDVGVYPGPANAPTVLIEASTNGNPSDIKFVNGVIQAGKINVQITHGGGIRFIGITFKASAGDGVQITALDGECSFADCIFKTNAATAGTFYDLDLSNATNWVNVDSCVFETAVGSGAGFVTNVVNDTNHRGYFDRCHFNGSGNTPSLVFSTGTPQLIRNCPGYNPRGTITPPTIGASPFSSNTSQNDVLIIFTVIAGMTAFKIGGTSVGLPAAGAPYRVPARQTLEVDWATTAPTWIWFAE